MTARRTIFMAFFGLLGGARGLLAQTADQDDQDTLKPRGAPTGRVGAATRGLSRPGAENVTIDLVAPSRGVGLTSSDQPTLCYLLSGTTTAPLRFTISMRGLARPLADMELPHPATGFGVIDLRGRNVRLSAGQIYVWSVTLRTDASAPSHDLVASALVQYQPGSPAFAKALREAPAGQQQAIYEQNGYWYDQVALATRDYARDNGSSLTELLRKAGLRTGASPSAPVR
jgi:Domain of Unknown Function (DUF928)